MKINYGSVIKYNVIWLLPSLHYDIKEFVLYIGWLFWYVDIELKKPKYDAMGNINKG